MNHPDINLAALASPQPTICAWVERDADPNTRTALRIALGLKGSADDPDMKASSFEPYLDYIESSWPGRGSKEDFLRFFADVASHFSSAPVAHEFDGQNASEPSRSIQQYIGSLIASPDHYYFPDTLPGSLSRAASVTEIVLLVLGTWLLLQPYFVPSRRDQRCIVLAFCLGRKKPYSESEGLAVPLTQLLTQSGLLPSADEMVLSGPDTSMAVVDGDTALTPFQLHSSMGPLESLVSPRRLNAVKLSTLGRVKFVWTPNIARHLLLSRNGERHCLELFAFPCALQSGGGKINPLIKTGLLSAELVDEIEASYATLFHPAKASRAHRALARVLGLRHWCWCLDCASYRLRRQVLAPLKTSDDKLLHKNDRARHYASAASTCRVKFDARLEVLMQRDASQWQWDRTEFTQLWPRILALDAHLERTRPWSFWVIFRDRRDTVQYWTFLYVMKTLLPSINRRPLKPRVERNRFD